MRDLRIYMAVGGMPQAVEAYINGEKFSKIDMVKRQIISLYEEDLKKIDTSGRIDCCIGKGIVLSYLGKKWHIRHFWQLRKLVLNKSREENIFPISANKFKQ